MNSQTQSSIEKHIVIFTVPDNQILDITGPLEVFSQADRWLRDNGWIEGTAYRVEIAALADGPVAMSSGLQLIATDYRKLRQVDTLLVAGGPGAECAVPSPELLSWLRRHYHRARRIGSVCTGAFILAQTGLLDGRWVTTHWGDCQALQQRYPEILVDADSIYLRDGKIYTSAGVTAGMDLALALVEEDWGAKVALAVAQQLVMYLKRPGGQSQFSSLLSMQQATRRRFEDLKLWVVEHLTHDLSVPRLAEQVAMSPRHFARTFACETGITPAKFVEMARVDAAQRLLEASELSMEEIATKTGLGCGETMRRAFRRQLSVSPEDYRRRFCWHAPDALRQASGSHKGFTRDEECHDGEIERRYFDL